MFSDQNNNSKLLLVTLGKDGDCPGYSRRKSLFFFFFLQAVMAVVFPGWDCIAGSLWETSACKMLCKYILHITCAI